MMDGFRSVQLEWDAFMTPSHATIQSYVVTYWLTSQLRSTAVTTTSLGNSTVLELRDLEPASHYSVVVQGRNSFGTGEESPVGTIMTNMGDVPPVPSSLDALVMGTGGEERSIVVSWMVSARGEVVEMWREGRGEGEEGGGKEGGGVVVGIHQHYSRGRVYRREGKEGREVD
jgi:hypothetical protein